MLLEPGWKIDCNLQLRQDAETMVCYCTLRLHMEEQKTYLRCGFLCLEPRQQHACDRQ